MCARALPALLLVALSGTGVVRAEPRPTLDDFSGRGARGPELGVRLLGLDLGLRHRFAVVRDERFPGMPENRFNAMLDFPF